VVLPRNVVGQRIWTSSFPRNPSKWDSVTLSATSSDVGSYQSRMLLPFLVSGRANAKVFQASRVQGAGKEFCSRRSGFAGVNGAFCASRDRPPARLEALCTSRCRHGGVAKAFCSRHSRYVGCAKTFCIGTPGHPGWAKAIFPTVSRHPNWLARLLTGAELRHNWTLGSPAAVTGNRAEAETTAFSSPGVPPRAGTAAPPVEPLPGAECYFNRQVMRALFRS
jgi:hypothetical protein